jgi:hypothetical protein
MTGTVRSCELAACAGAEGEPRGPGVFPAGPVHGCGQATTWSGGGLPRHKSAEAAGPAAAEGTSR